MGGMNFAWLAVWVLSPDWPSRKLQVCNFLGAQVEPSRLGERSTSRAPCGASWTVTKYIPHLLLGRASYWGVTSINE